MSSEHRSLTPPLGAGTRLLDAPVGRGRGFERLPAKSDVG